MHAFLFLLYRAEMVLGWTWRSMLAGEEQFLYGIIGHDGIPTKNYDEYRQLASDFLKLQGYAFPYIPKPQIGVAYNFENKMAAIRQPKQFDNRDYTSTVMEALVYLSEKNYDYNIVDIRHLTQTYKLLIVPAYYLMDPAAADGIRNFVANGGTVVMTGFSAMLDKNNAVFDLPRPGLLDDVFGIRVVTFERTNVNWKHNEIIENKMIEIERKGKRVISKSNFYEELELRSAVRYAEFSGKNLTALSVNAYGKGKAYYAAFDTDSVALGFLLPEILEELGLPLPLAVPAGVMARKIAEGQHFYVNTLDTDAKITLPENGYGVLSGKYYDRELYLPPFEAELIVNDV
jgi:beta-galactosidase